ncbi:hypothetical protein B0H12DRAFT_1069594 [Mycena haematopus]|nr:hypothetical protein B0H12DRAFT_1069594 [Mycena haematopus]
MSSDTVFHFHGLSRALDEYAFESLRSQWHNSLDHVGSFPFIDLPIEIAVAILKLAAAKSGTYPALMATSRAIATMARFEFHPGVGAGVKQLWLFPALAVKQATIVFPAILNACYNVERLACKPDHLIEISNSDSGAFRHKSLVDVTMVDPIIPWDRLFASRHGAALFNQIQMLRLVGGTQHNTAPPLNMFFRNLTDLTISAVTTTCIQNYIRDPDRFPSLERVVVTVQYTDWRTVGMAFLMSEPELQDSRLCVVHCSKKWKELDVWKGAKFNIWNLGATEWNARTAANNTGSTLREHK